MVESINAAAPAGDDLKKDPDLEKGAGGDLEKGAGAGEAAVAQPSTAVYIASYLCLQAPRCILWAAVLWLNIDHLLIFGPWSALAFFVVQALPVLVLSCLKPVPPEEEERMWLDG